MHIDSLESYFLSNFDLDDDPGAYLEMIWGWYTDFGDTLFWCPNSRKVEKEKQVLHKNKKLPPVTLFWKLNIKSEQINKVSKTKNCHSSFTVILT